MRAGPDEGHEDDQRAPPGSCQQQRCSCFLQLLCQSLNAHAAFSSSSAEVWKRRAPPSPVRIVPLARGFEPWSFDGICVGRFLSGTCPTHRFGERGLFSE